MAIYKVIVCKFAILGNFFDTLLHDEINLSIFVAYIDVIY